MGKIYFLLVRIKIRYMELAIVRREVTGAGIRRSLGQKCCHMCLRLFVHHVCSWLSGSPDLDDVHIL